MEIRNFIYTVAIILVIVLSTREMTYHTDRLQKSIDRLDSIVSKKDSIDFNCRKCNQSHKLTIKRWGDLVK